jgi:hypothetical protein
MDEIILVLLALSVVFAPAMVVFLLLESQSRGNRSVSPSAKPHENHVVRK